MKEVSNSTKLKGAFCVLGLTIGLLVGVPTGWTVHPPKTARAIPSINVNLTKEELVKRLGTPTNLTQPTKANPYTVVEYDSKDRGLNGQPVWVMQIAIK